MWQSCLAQPLWGRTQAFSCIFLVLCVPALASCGSTTAAPPGDGATGGPDGGPGADARVETDASAPDGGSEAGECGDGRRSPGEECDGEDLNGQSCESLGLGGGSLRCTEQCALDTSRCAEAGGEVSGIVVESASGSPIPRARITVFRPDLSLFREARTDAEGRFTFAGVPAGEARIGAAARGFEYVERAAELDGLAAEERFELEPEDHPGRWEVVGDTAPELLNGTGSGSLLDDGEVLYCHDTVEPVVFDPVTEAKWFPQASGAVQGCHAITLMTDGRLLFVGGARENGNPQDPVVSESKAYYRPDDQWTMLASMNVGRWYPGLVRLPNEELLVIGGDVVDPGFGRTDTCEIYDPVLDRWTITGSIARPTEMPPSVLLLTGDVLKTWRDVELYDPEAGEWRATDPLIQARVGPEPGDHSDHGIVMLPDGRVLALGIDPMELDGTTSLAEIYDPNTGQWSLGPSPRHLRARPESLILADGRVLAFGGEYAGPMESAPELGSAGLVDRLTRVADIYDPETNRWRAAADMNRFIHYHNVSVLVPDGRVIATAGAGEGGDLFGDDPTVESFWPPYLFRGVQPRIDTVSEQDLRPGSAISIDVSFTSSPTSVVLVGFRAVTHWIDGGPQRYLRLPLEVTPEGSGVRIETVVPDDPSVALAGYYMLFVLVDDIPSRGRIVRILPAE